MDNTAVIKSASLLACRPGQGLATRDLVRYLLAQLWWIHRNPAIPPALRTWAYRKLLQVRTIKGASKSDFLENGMLALVFNATTIANIAINATSSPLTALAVALHTSDPGEAGTMSTNETTYTSYARVNVNRNSGGWTVSGNSVAPAANIDFPKATGGTATITHASIGYTGGGAVNILYYGVVTPNINVATNSIPRLDTSTLITEV